MVEAARTRLSPRTRRWLPYALLFVIVMTLVGVHVHRYPILSPIDELRHLDYLERASNFDFPKLGDKLHQEAMREEACRGLAITPPVTNPPCDSKHFKPKAFRDDGYQNATFHPPTYYLAGGLLSRAVVEVGISDSLVEPARVFSGLLLAIGLLLTLLAGRLAGIRTVPVMAATLISLAAPAVLGGGVYVNPDSASILTGAAVLCVALLWERGRVPMWALAVVGGAATAFKLTNALAVAIVALWFVIRAMPPDWPARLRARFSLSDDHGPPIEEGATTGYPHTTTMLGSRQYLRAAAYLVVGALAVAMLWTFIDSARATIDAGVIPQNQAFAADGFPTVEQLLQPGILFAFFPPFPGFQSSFLFTDTWVSNIALFATYVFCGGMIIQALRFRRDSRMTIIGLATVITLLFGSVAFTALQVVVNDIFNTPAARYGLSAVPAMVLVLAAVVRGRTGRVMLGTVACIVVGVLFLAIAF